MQPKVITSYRDTTVLNDPNIIANIHKRTYTPTSDLVLTYIQNNQLPGSTAIVFSGSWNYQLPAVYFEDQLLKELPLNFHKDTFFIDAYQKNTLENTLTNGKFTNLVFIRSPFLRYQPPDKILEKIKYFKTLLQPNGQLIVALPILFIEFNRLKYTIEDLAKLLQGQVVDRSIIIKDIA